LSWLEVVTVVGVAVAGREGEQANSARTIGVVEGVGVWVEVAAARRWALPPARPKAMWGEASPTDERNSHSPGVRWALNVAVAEDCRGPDCVGVFICPVVAGRVMRWRTPAREWGAPLQGTAPPFRARAQGRRRATRQAGRAAPGGLPTRAPRPSSTARRHSGEGGRTW